jgi:hypothetical protein
MSPTIESKESVVNRHTDAVCVNDSEIKNSLLA